MRVLGIALAAVVLLLMGVRAYFSDGRLRDMVVAELEKSGAEVSLTSLDFELTSGLVLDELRMGPAPGFTLDTVRFKRMAVRWSMWELLRLRVVLDELALENAEVVLEENDSGKNVDAIVKSLLGAPSEAPPPPPPKTNEPVAAPPPEPQAPKAPEPFAPPSLPVRVEVTRLALVDFAAKMISSKQRIEIDRVNVRGAFVGEGQSVELDLWAGVGNPENTAEQSRLVLVQPEQDVTSSQHAFVKVETHGFGDIRVGVRMNAAATVKKPLALPPLTASGDVDLTVDLLANKATLSRCEWKLGQRTFFRTTLTSTDILTAPAIQLTELALNLDLDELAPVVRAAQPGTSVAGVIKAQLAPFASTVDALTKNAVPNTQLDFEAMNLHAQQNDLVVRDLDVQGAVKLLDSVAQLGLKAQLVEALAAGQTAKALGAELDVSTPVTPFLGGPPAGVVDAKLVVKVGEAGSPSALANDVRFGVTAAVPVALALAQPSESPLTAHVALDVGSARTPDAQAKKIALGIDAQVFDLAGSRLDAKVGLKIAEARQGAGDAALVVPDVGMSVHVRRALDDYFLKTLDLDVAGVMTGHVAGDVFAATSPAPRFRNFALRFDIPRLDAVLSLLPASQRPKMELVGAMSWDLSLNGTVPHVALVKDATPPKISLAPGSGTTWEQAVQAYADFSMRWAKRLGRGLPFVLTTKLALNDVSMRDASNDVEGLKMAMDLVVADHGPRWSYARHIDKVTQPVVASGITLETTFEGDADLIAVSFGAAAASYQDKTLSAPLVGAGMNMKASYHLQGDLVLERFSIEAPELGLLISTNGVVTKPLQLFMQRGWEKPLLPGIDIALRWQLGFGTEKRTAALTVEGPVLGGTVGLGGKLVVKDGLMSLDGAFEARHFVFRAPGSSLEDMSGTFPFSMGVLFGKRADAVVVARDLAVGGGVVSLLASDSDIRQRSARPAYYDRLRPYRAKPGLSIKEIHSGPYEVLNFRADARVSEGIFTFDTLSMSVLGGDIVGRMAFQLARDASIRGDMVFQTSGLDASYFKLLKLQAGPESELNADFSSSFLFGPRTRDLSMDMNVTKIGSKTLDRFLMLLDPEGKDENIQNTRSKLWMMDIYGLSTWVRFEKLNMDLDYDTFARVPLTRVSYRPVPKELLRRSDISEYLNTYLTPHLQRYAAPMLGWANAQ